MTIILFSTFSIVTFCKSLVENIRTSNLFMENLKKIPPKT